MCSFIFSQCRDFKVPVKVHVDSLLPRPRPSSSPISRSQSLSPAEKDSTPALRPRLNSSMFCLFRRTYCSATACSEDCAMYPISKQVSK